MADIILRSRNFSFYYTDDGAVPQELAVEFTPDNAFSVFFYTSDPTIIALLFVIHFLIAIQLLVGYKTRLAVILSFLFVISLDHHNPFVLSYADVLFRLLLFWAIFLPLGERWSVDAIHRERSARSGIASLASAAILVQIVYMYFVNGYHKTESELWTGGDATVLIMGLDNITFLLGEFTRNFPTLLQYGGLTWYYMLLFSWLLIFLRGRARMLFTAMFLGGHASFAITVRIGAFAYVAMVGLILFMQPQFWDDLRSVARTVPIRKDRFNQYHADIVRVGKQFPQLHTGSVLHNPIFASVYHLTLSVAVMAVLVVPAISLMPVGGFIDKENGPKDQIEERAEIIGVDQPPWSVFAPHPRTTDRYYVFPARTENGEIIDAFNERVMTYERPTDELQRQFGTYRERFYMNSVRRGGPDNIVSEHLAEYLCSVWPDEFGEELTHINMYYVVEGVTLDTIDDPDERATDVRGIYGHGCGDKEAQQLSPP